MDILEANFPQLFPGKPTVQKMADAESLPITGERGIANDEARSSADVVQCDEVFLDSLMSHLKLAELKIYMQDDPYKVVTAYRSNQRRHDPTQWPRDMHMRHAVTILSKIQPEITRLSLHPELFASGSRRDRFLEEAGGLADLCLRYLDISKEERDLVPSLQKKLDDAEARRPTDPETGQKLQPWETFTRSLNKEKLFQRPGWKEAVQELPGMHLHSALVLPPSATLIVERNKARLDWYMGTAENPPADMLALQHTSGELFTSVDKEGEFATMTRPSSVSAELAMKPHLACGRQERVAEMSRYMALLDRDVTTVHAQPPGTFLGTFLSDEGMRRVKEKAAAAAKELHAEE